MKNILENNKAKIKAILKYLWEILIDALVIIFIVVVVRYFLISPFQIQWSSMKDTFFHWDYIFVEKLSYRFSEPKFWDIVIFTPPVPRTNKLSWFRCIIQYLNELSIKPDVCNNYPDKYIKRVIWTPWDIIKIENWAVYRNWKILSESEYLNKNNDWKTYLLPFHKVNEFIVPKESVFVLWDNRNGSSDSRRWSKEWEIKPFVPYNNLIWKYIVKVFSPSYIFWEKEKPFLILK